MSVVSWGGKLWLFGGFDAKDVGQAKVGRTPGFLISASSTTEHYCILTLSSQCIAAY